MHTPQPRIALLATADDPPADPRISLVTGYFSLTGYPLGFVPSSTVSSVGSATSCSERGPAPSSYIGLYSRAYTS